MVRSELLSMLTEHVARKLVEQDHACQSGERVIEEAFDGKLALLRPKLEEALPDPVIELRPAAPPLLFRESEPEFEDLGLPVARGFGTQAAVPPTVRPSISSVG